MRKGGLTRTVIYGIQTEMNWQKREYISVSQVDDLAPVVQTMDSAVHRINYYVEDKHKQNQLSYPVDSDLSGG